MSMLNHFLEVLGLTNEDAQCDTIVLEGNISSTAIVNPDPIPLAQDFEYEVVGMYGYIQSPATNPANFTRAKFNITMDGARRPMFDVPVKLGAMVNTTGVGQIVHFKRGMYRLYRGKELQLKFEASGTGSWAGATAVDVGIVLLVNKVSPLLRTRFAARLASLFA